MSQSNTRNTESTEIAQKTQKNSKDFFVFFSVSYVQFLFFLCSCLRFNVVQVTTLFFIALPAYSTTTSIQFSHIKTEFKASDTWLLDRHGEQLHRLRTNAQVRKGEWIALQEMSPALRQAMVLSEDKRFYEHSGVDWKAVSAAAWGNLLNQRTRGASTLSMQLASLVEDGPRTSSERKSIIGKAGQAIFASVLERSWRKDEILEAYLNLVPFRGEVQGIDALSRTLFGKAAHGLDAREAAISAALVRAPNAKAATVGQRACGVLRAMQPTTPQECEALQAYTAAVLPRKAWQPSDGPAPHVAQKLLNPLPHVARKLLASKPAITQSSLHAPLQRHALQTLRQHLSELRGRNVEDGAVVVLDNASGQVLAYVGSSGDLGDAQEVDAAAALRQAGSTLKPFLYAQAIAENRITAASLLEDSPAHIPTASGLYIPQNYDRSFKGWVSVRTALGASLNVPAVRALVMVSPEAFAQQLRAVGLPLKNDGDFYGYSLALGSADVSLLSLTNAYRTLANGGRYSPTSFSLSPAPKFTAALNPESSFIVSDMLSDNNARARTFGTDSVLTTRFWSAVKTGTSKDMRDNWAIGFSQRYTVGVWVGNASGESMWDVSGVSGAAPVWASVMGFLHQRQRSDPPKPPAGLSAAHVALTSPSGAPIEAARREWFIAGSEVSTINSIALRADSFPASGSKSLKNTDQTASKITSPAQGTVIALDPDIPPQSQRLQLRAQGMNARWLLNGQSLGASKDIAWLPMPGRHTLQLADAQGKVLDEVKFEVRGASFKTASVKTTSHRAK